MKNELLARAISELDDDLIEEARQPIQKKKYLTTHLSRWVAAAACFVVLATALIPLQSEDDVGVFVNGVNMMSENSIEISMTAPKQQRQIAKTEICLNIFDARSITLISDENSILVQKNGTEDRKLVVSGDTEITWVINDSMRSTFELKLLYDDQIIIITAEVNQAKDCVIVTSSCELQL